jgi:hypothetical protein
VDYQATDDESQFVRSVHKSPVVAREASYAEARPDALRQARRTARRQEIGGLGWAPLDRFRKLTAGGIRGEVRGESESNLAGRGRRERAQCVSPPLDPGRSGTLYEMPSMRSA